MNLISNSDPILHTPTTPVPAEMFGTTLLADLTDCLYKTMVIEQGIGLAGPQVGSTLSIFAMRENRVVINPEITWASDEVVVADEGCLSYPNWIVPMSRPVQIEVRYFTPGGEVVEEMLTGMAARCFQHEYDHLRGVCFVDGLSPLKRQLLMKKAKKRS